MSSATLSDFSAALLRAGSKDQNRRYKGDQTVNISSGNYTSGANQNLSNLLSQIQDDGPAYTESIKRESLFNRTRAYEEQSSQQASAPVSNTSMPNAADVPLPETRNVHVRAAGKPGAATGQGTVKWILFSVLTGVVIVSGGLLYKLDLRTSELEASLDSSGVSVQGSVISREQSEELLASLQSTSETLRSIQTDLQNIKTEYKVLDEKVTVSMANEGESQNNGLMSIRDSVGELKREILALKTDLQTVKSELLESNAAAKSAGNTVTHSGLTVHLASLTNKNKAEEVVDRLHKADLNPFIQTVVVKGKQVYRLSVSGFSTRNEAEAFIDEAGQKYGMKGGWIRES